jgi:hypothetical protein
MYMGSLVTLFPATPIAADGMWRVGAEPSNYISATFTSGYGFIAVTGSVGTNTDGDVVIKARYW